MPVEKLQKLTLLDYPEKGTNTNLDADIQIQGETTLTVVCESPTCNTRISWVVEKAGQNAEGVPDDAFRILVLEEFAGTKHVFCSWECLRRAMKSYVPPLSPREKAQIEAHNSSLDAKKEADVNAVAAAVSQPDGYAGESAHE